MPTAARIPAATQAVQNAKRATATIDQAGSAVVGSAARENAQNAHRMACVVADVQHPPVPDAQPELGSSGEATYAAGRLVGAEPVDGVENAVHHRRVEATEVALRARRKLGPPRSVAHAWWRNSSTDMVCPPAANSS